MASEETATESPFDDGEQLARIYCAMCHQFTEPDLLPKDSWNFLLTYMGMRMGIVDFSYVEHLSPQEKHVIESRKQILDMVNMIPPAPMLNDAQWKALREYYMHNAPENSLPQKAKPAMVEDRSLFAEKDHRHLAQGAVTALVHIDEANQQLIIGDIRTEKFTILDEQLKFVIDSQTRNSLWIRADVTDEGIYLLSIGDISGSAVDKRLGRVFYGKRVAGMYLPQGVALDNLYRPSDMAFGDLNGDGKDEVVICNFGIGLGDVSIHEKEESGFAFKTKPLLKLSNDSGAVGCEIHDFNGDGLLDVAVLLSDARERFVIYLNRGNFEFDTKTVIESHPAFGYAGFQLIDFNKDGHMDIITVNGDNVDSDPYNTLKRYHGIRIYLSDGSLSFEESYFYPMYGAYGIEAHDFDLDGDLDIAAIAFNPDFNSDQPEHFVFLEQVADLQFAAKTHPSTSKGRWMTMDAGDLDQDGDVDIVLGAGYVSLGLLIGNMELFEKMARNGPPILFLDNQTID